MARMGPSTGPRHGPRHGPNPSLTLSIRIVGHGLVDGDGPFYVNTTGTRPAPLVGDPYYAISVDADHFQLASSRVNALAGTAIELTDAGTGVHTIDTTNATSPTLTALVGYSDTFVASFGDGLFDLTGAGSDVADLMADGDGPVQLTTTNTLPGPYALATDYWVINATGSPSAAGTARNLAASYVDAIARTEIVLIDDGVGVHTIASTGASEHRAHVALADATPFTVS